MSVYIVPDQVMLLERPLLKVPHEQLRRTLRASQKTIERDFSHIRSLSEQTKGIRPSRSRNTRSGHVAASTSANTSAMNTNTASDADLSMDMEMTEDDSMVTDSAPGESMSGFSSAATAAATLAAISSRKRSISGTTVTNNSTTVSSHHASAFTDDKELVSEMLARVKALRNKISDSSSQNMHNLASAKERLLFLQKLHCLPPSSTITSPDYASWSSRRLAVHIVDFLLRLGYISIAECVAQEYSVTDLVDIKFWKDCHRIETALLKGSSVTEALAWCKDNQSALKKMKNTLEFSLRLQEFVELIRAQKHQEAITYSRKWLIPWSDSHMPQLRQAMALLAFGPDTECPPYRILFEKERWEDLARQFRATVFELHSLLPVPPFLLSMYTGLSALKTSACYNKKEHEAHDECPTCDEFDLGIIASQKPVEGGVPWSHHVNSSLVCKITGKVMEGENYPMAMPNGRVYSKQALEEMAIASNNGKVRCPRTGEEYNYDELRKVYIL